MVCFYFTRVNPTAIDFERLAALDGFVLLRLVNSRLVGWLILPDRVATSTLVRLLPNFLIHYEVDRMVSGAAHSLPETVKGATEGAGVET